MTKTLGFIGLGKMGAPMARNLLAAGYQVTLFNRTPLKATALATEFAAAQVAATPAEVARQSQVVFFNLSTPAAVEEMLVAALAAAQPGTLFIDHSTIGVADARRFADLCAARGCQFLDAPVSGGPWGAAAGSLAIMVGGPAAVFAAAKPLLSVVGKNLYHCGPHGAGTAAKLCNNLLVGIHQAALNEAMVLGTKAGLDPSLLYEIVSNSTGFSNVMGRSLPGFIFKGSFEAAFSVDHLYKDVGLANALGKETGTRMLLAALTEQLLAEARAAGHGAFDISATILPLEELTGVKVRG